jgi:hypothetical protein
MGNLQSSLRIDSDRAGMYQNRRHEGYNAQKKFRRPKEACTPADPTLSARLPCTVLGKTVSH